MSKSPEIQDKPLVVSKIPSANWKRFLSESGMNSKKKKKRDSPDPLLSMLDDEDDHNGKLLQRLPVAVGIDCEMVGVASSKKDMLARVSIVDMHGKCIYDKFVKPTEKVVDYRTWVSGIRPRDLKKGESYTVVREKVASLLKEKIVVGHAVSNDFRVLNIKHPKHLIRDSSFFPIFREMFDNKTPSLRNLARAILGVNIQSGEHSSIQDATAAIQVYMIYRREWEEYIREKFEKKRNWKLRNEVKPVSTGSALSSSSSSSSSSEEL